VDRRAISLFAALLALPLASAAAAHAGRAPSLVRAPAGDERAIRDPDVSADRGVALSLGVAEQGRPFASFPALRISNARGLTREVRLYDDDGSLDDAALRSLDALLADTRDAAEVRSIPIEHRSLQLLFRAAYHFGASAVQVVSGYRQPGRRTEGYHAEGKAIDFKLPGVRAVALASYLRTLSRVGVGVYTNRRTQFVHLDVRDRSFFWLDASPPGRRWRERPIRNASMGARDASYQPSEDWPEGTRPRGV